MEYAEKGSLADAIRVGRLKGSNGFPDLQIVISCLLDIASGTTPSLCCITRIGRFRIPNCSVKQLFCLRVITSYTAGKPVQP